jgi:hypothetical protein
MVWFTKCKVLFCNSSEMKRARKKYSIFQFATSVFMILALLWLTISAPFIYNYQQKISTQDKVNKSASPADINEEETANPFGNNAEEKASGSINSFSEEYLHDHHVTDHFFSISSQYHKCEDAGTYVAFHGELLVPPPNMA